MSDRSFVYDAMFEIALKDTAESIARCCLRNEKAVKFVNFREGDPIVGAGCCHYTASFSFNEYSEVQVDLSLINPREVLPPETWSMETALIEAAHWDGCLFFDDKGLPNMHVFGQCLYPREYTADDLKLEWRILAIQLIIYKPVLRWSKLLPCTLQDLRYLYHQKQWCGIPPVSEDDKDILCPIAQKKGYLLGGSA